MSNIRSGSKVAYLSENPFSGTNRITLEAPWTIDNDFTFTFPSDMGSYGDILMTNSSTTSWEKPGRFFRTEVNSSTYSIQESDRIIGVIYTTSGAVSLDLPSIISGYAKITIVDEGGMAKTNNITINPYPFSGNKIMGQDSYVINSNYGSVSLYHNGNFGDPNWFIESEGIRIISRTVVNTSQYIILPSDKIIGVEYTANGTVSLDLPPTTVSFDRITIVDEGGMAGLNNIVINANETDTIIGQSSLIINSDYNSVSLYNNRNGKWFIG